MKTPHAKIMVAMPVYTGTVDWRTLESFFAAIPYTLYHGIELYLEVAAGYSLVQYARNELARRFLADEKYTHILWVDADLGFAGDAIVKLLDHGKDVAAGVYTTKSFPNSFPYQPLEEPVSALHRAVTVPTGFLLVSRRAIAAVAETVPTYIHFTGGAEIPTKHIFDLELTDHDGKPALIGEDTVLSHRLTKSGFEIWVDPDIGFRHCGRFEWAGHLATTIKKHQRAPDVAAPVVPLARSSLCDAIAAEVNGAAA